MKHFIGIDLGTQSMKGILMDPEGKLLAKASAQYIPEFPGPNLCEHDVNAWKEALKEIIGALLSESEVPADEIGMLGYASQCGGIIPVATDGEAIRKAILWLDRRAEPQCEELREIISPDEALRIVGSNITSTLRAPKIMWLRENEPEIYEKATAFLDCGEYMVYWMTGELTSDYAHSSITCLYDVGKREWSERMVSITGIDPSRLGRVMAAADVAGQIRPEIASYLGLDPATRIVVGSGDQHAGSVGSGLAGPGDVLNIMGTSEIIAGASDKLVFDEKKLLKTHLHVDPRYWQIEQGALVSGGCVRWYVDNIARVSYPELNAGAASVPAGADGLLFFPGLGGSNGPEINGYARGIFFGFTQSHTIPYFTRALYEGLAFAFRDNFDALDDLGMGNGSIIACGGSTQSDVWMQIKSDVVQREIKLVKNEEPTALGAAMLCGVAQGNFKDFTEACDKLMEYGKTFTPNPAMKELYDEQYAFYRDLYFENKKMFDHYRK